MKLVRSAKKLKGDDLSWKVANTKDENFYVSYKPGRDTGQEIKLMEEVDICPMIDPGQNIRLFVSGISGSGKSTFVATMVKKIRQIKGNKKKPAYLISLGSQDPAFEDSNIMQIDMTMPEYFDLDYRLLENSIIIFDDYNQLSEKDPVFVHTMKIQKQCLELGRKKKTDVICVNHATQDYKKTKYVIFECNAFCLFPAANLNSVVKFCKEYMDMDKDQLKKIKDNSELGKHTILFIHKAYPRYQILTGTLGTYMCLV